MQGTAVEDTTMGPFDFFKNMHGVFARILAAGHKPEVLFDRLTGQAFDFFEQNIVLQAEGLPDLACHKGCASCCTLRVTATAPEVFQLAHYVRLIDASPGGAPINLPKRIAQANRATNGLGESERMALRRPCPFILRGVCIVHPVRPLACRGHASFDRTACARAASGRNVEVPVSEPHLHLRGLVQHALQSALRGAGVAWGLYELNHGLVVALTAEQRLAAWMAGEDSLAPMLADVDMTEMAAMFDNILAAQ
jgi:Fe-S-cluster containining protein